jgi:hypothetical protein
MIRTTNIHATGRFFAATIVAAMAFAMSSQTAMAQGTSLAGVWKIDPAKSNFSAGSARLSIARDGAGFEKTPGTILVVSDDGNVYLTTSTAMREAASAGIKTADYSRAQTGKMLLIGTNAQRDGFCGFRCQSGVMERTLTLRFTSIDGAEQLMGQMLAYKAPK